MEIVLVIGSGMAECVALLSHHRVPDDDDEAGGLSSTLARGRKNIQNPVLHIHY